MSKLLTYKYTVDNWDISKELAALEAKFKLMQNNITDFNNSFFSFDMSMIDMKLDEMKSELHELASTIDTLKKASGELCRDEDKKLLVENYEWYFKRRTWFNLVEAERTRNRDLFNTNDELALRFNNLVKEYASWQFPSVYIRPNTLRFFDALKASDFLYIMEQIDVTKYIKENLSKAEYNTVRFKLINETKKKFITEALPIGQMGLIVMEDFINFKPISIIKQYLEESHEVLTPGGTLMFTFNDCDLPAGATMAQEGVYAYTPGYMIRELCDQIGFDIIKEETSSRISYMCLRKEGTLTSLKAGKTLGEIVSN